MDILAFLRERAGAFRCPMCRRSLADCKLKQLDHEGQKYTVEVTCRNCNLAFLVALELAPNDEAEVDQAEPEGELMAGADPELDPISSDELLELHRTLDGYSGPLTALLRERAND
ncbi:MAG TPA: hypothetical protein VNH38_06100 [Candidatus Dormibacteraeota bacterium]|nr:hypothetical protein [Candidatus Dormibacteraeota bacterium]